MGCTRDESHQYPITWGATLLGVNSEWGVLAMADWKYTLVPHVGVQGENFTRKSATLLTLRCPRRRT